MTGRYDVVFRGELQAGEDPGVVRQRLAALFKSPPGAIERLFSGQPVILRRDVDEVTASRYRDALRKAGAVCHLRPSAAGGARGDAPPPAAAASERTPAPPRAGSRGESGDESGVESGVEVPPPSPDLASATILPAGTPFDQPPRAAPPTFDFAGLSLAEAGETIAESRTAPVRDIDTSHLAILPLGAGGDGR